MKINLGKLKGGAQILAKTAIAQYVVESEEVINSVVPVDRENFIRHLQTKCGLVDEADFDKFSNDINSICEVIKNQELDYINRTGNAKFKLYKTMNSPAQMREKLNDIEEQLLSTLQNQN